MGDHLEVASDLFDDSGDDGEAEHGHEEVGRDGEERARLADTPQVPVDEHQHDADGDGDGEGNQAGDGAGQRCRAGRALDGHRHDVVDHQRHRRHLGHPGAEVVSCHHVGAACRRVVLDHVEVGARDEEQHADDHEHDGHDHGEGGEPDVGRQLGEDLLGAIGRGRDAVRSEHSKSGEAVEPLPAELLGDIGATQKDALDAVAERFGKDRADVSVRGHDLGFRARAVGCRHEVDGTQGGAVKALPTRC